MRKLIPIVLLTGALAPAQTIGLEALAEIARERADRQRPALLAALEPFQSDLELAYSGANDEYLDTRFEEIAAIDPPVVPLLLEYLTPADGSDAALNRAENSARALRRLHPASFCDSLLDIASGKNPVARRHALWLLGFTGADRAAEAIIDRLATLDRRDRAIAIASLRNLRSPRALEPATEALKDDDQKLRSQALLTLIDLDAEATAIDAVLAAFAAESSDSLLDLYIEYFARHVREDERVTGQLLPLVTGVRLPLDDREALVRALGKIAPRRHRPTIETLEQVVEEGLVGELEKAAALSLLALDEKDGVREITERLDQAIRRRRDDPDAYVARADWYAALERWREAIRDYESAIEYGRSGSRQAAMWLEIARCEAHRGKLSRLKAALKKSGVRRETILREASRDPVFLEALQKDSVERFLKTLD